MSSVAAQAPQKRWRSGFSSPHDGHCRIDAQCYRRARMVLTCCVRMDRHWRQGVDRVGGAARPTNSWVPPKPAASESADQALEVRGQPRGAAGYGRQASHGPSVSGLRETGPDHEYIRDIRAAVIFAVHRGRSLRFAAKHARGRTASVSRGLGDLPVSPRSEDGPSEGLRHHTTLWRNLWRVSGARVASAGTRFRGCFPLSISQYGRRRWPVRSLAFGSWTSLRRWCRSSK
jgi:hypothetical protein